MSKQQGWETAHSAGHIVWVVRKEDLGTCLLNLNQKARLSHIPGMHEVCEKAALASALEAVAAPFWPRSWRPQDLDFSVAKESVVIVKPSKGLQGRGIHLAGSPEELRQILAADADVVVQEYISSPLLLDGRKWDLRLYALVVPGYDGGLRCWLARDGLVRVCTDPYREPDATNLRCQTAHLTNYSLNKRSEKFVRNEDPGNGRHGCKRTFSAVLAGLQADGLLEVSTTEIWSSLEELASETIRAMASPLRRLAQEPAIWEGSEEVARAASQKFDQCFHSHPGPGRAPGQLVQALAAGGQLQPFLQPRRDSCTTGEGQGGLADLVDSGDWIPMCLLSAPAGACAQGQPG